MKCFTQHFLKHKTLGEVFVRLDGHRAHCNSPLLLQAAVENNVTIICVTGHCIRDLQPLDKCFFGGGL
jgi:hypothetical protein